MAKDVDKLKAGFKIGVVAPSFPFFKEELAKSIEKIESCSSIRFVKSKHLFEKEFIFSGSDEIRAKSFFEMARDKSLSALWCARGGYGAARLLERLDRLAKKFGKPPRKSLVGYSDVTALLDYVQTEWGWDAIHAPMLGTREFSKLSPRQFKDILLAVQGLSSKRVIEEAPLVFLGKKPRHDIHGKLKGGNLSVIVSLIGTPHEMVFKNAIVFLEDTGEPLYRLDRMLWQLLTSGGLDQAKAVVLGTFSDCEDRVIPGLRPKIEKEVGIRTIFSTIVERIGIPVAMELPVGHSEGSSNHGLVALPIGVKAVLTTQGRIRV